MYSDNELVNVLQCDVELRAHQQQAIILAIVVMIKMQMKFIAREFCSTCPPTQL